MKAKTMNRYKVLGINQDANFCECCGKIGLNSVVWILDTDTDVIKHFGQVCASKPAKGFDCIKEIKDAISDIESRIKTYTTPKILMSTYREKGGKYKNPDAYDFTPLDAKLWQSIYDTQVAAAYKQI